MKRFIPWETGLSTGMEANEGDASRVASPGFPSVSRANARELPKMDGVLLRKKFFHEKGN